MKKLFILIALLALPYSAFAAGANNFDSACKYPENGLDARADTCDCTGVAAAGGEASVSCWDSTDGTGGTGDTIWSDLNDIQSDAIIELEKKVGSSAASSVDDTPSDDQALMGTDTNKTRWTSIGDCDDTGGNHLNYDTTSNAFSCGTSVQSINIADTAFTAGTGIAFSTDDIAIATTEVGDTTWGGGTDFTWTFNPAGATNPTIAFVNGIINLSAIQEGGIAVLNNDEMDASSELITIIDDETGSGSGTPLIVFNQGPTINGATLTGVLDAGGATSFEIPNSAGSTVDAVGKISVDTTEEALQFYMGTTAYKFDMTGYAAGKILKASSGGGFTLEDDATAGSPTLDTVGNPSAAWAITLNDNETVTWTTENDSNNSFFKITNSDAGLASGNQYLFELNYSAAGNDSNASADFINCTDSDSSVFSVSNTGDVGCDAITATGAISGTVYTATGGVAPGDITMYEGNAGGENYVQLSAPSAVTNNVTLILPDLETANTNNIIVSDNTKVTSVDGDALEIASGVLNVNDVAPTMLQSADFGDFTCNGTSCATDNGSIGVADLASVDFGTFTCNGSACTADNDSIALGTQTSGNYAASSSEAGDASGLACTTCVAVTELANADFGDFTCTGTSCGVDNGTIAAADLATADFGDFSVSAGTATLDAGTVDASELAATLTFAENDTIDMAATQPDTTASAGDGLILPTSNVCSGATTEGQICWDIDGDTLYVGTSGGVTAIGSGGSPLWNNIQNPTNDGLTTITFNNGETTKFSTNLDAASTFFTVEDTDADLANETVGMSIDFYDAQGDTEMTYLQMRADTDGTPVIEFLFDDKGLKVGNGSPTVTMNGEDLYVEGTLETDEAARVASLTVDGDATVTGNDLTFGNAESIDNNTNGTIDINATTMTIGSATDYLTITNDGDGVVISDEDDGTDDITIGDNVDTVTISAGNWDVDASGNLSANTLSTATATDPYVKFNVTNAGETDWVIGTNADTGGDNNDVLEFRYNDTQGSDEKLEIIPPTGDIRFNGATDDANKTTFDITDPTGTRAIVVPDASGTIAISATAPATLNATTGDIGVTVLKDLVTTSPLSGGTDNILPGADSDVTIAIADAAADGSTKGAATFTATDFDATTGVISIDNSNLALTSLSVGALTGVDSIDATGAVDMDYGSADITDHTFVSDGGTVVIDGSVTTPAAENPYLLLDETTGGAADWYFNVDDANNRMEISNAALGGTSLVTIADTTGNTTILGDLTVTGGDIASGASATPTIKLTDTTCTDYANDADHMVIAVDGTGGAAAEDVDFTISAKIDGDLDPILDFAVGSDPLLTIGSSGSPVDVTLASSNLTVGGTTTHTGTSALNDNVTVADGKSITFDEAAADPDDADVKLSAADGKLTIVSVNGANNEDITIDTDAAANVVTIDSSTAAGIYFNAPSGGRKKVIPAGSGTTYTLTAADMLGHVYSGFWSGTTEYILPSLSAAEVGINACFINTSGAIEINTSGNDTMAGYFNAVSLAIEAGHCATHVGASGSIACVLATSADLWVFTYMNDDDWADGGTACD